MLEKIKEQLGSTDEELVKQAITLLLDLGLEEETEKAQRENQQRILDGTNSSDSGIMGYRDGK